MDELQAPMRSGDTSKLMQANAIDPLRSITTQWQIMQDAGLHIAPLSPALEDERLKELYLLDSTDESNFFGRIANMCARMFGVPIVIINFFDNDRQWFTAKIESTVYSNPLAPECQFFAYAAMLAADAPTVISDILGDARFFANLRDGELPLIHDSAIRFYAGVPLKIQDMGEGEGEGGGAREREGEEEGEIRRLRGAICIADYAPRDDFNEELQSRLFDLAALLVERMEYRRQKCNTKLVAELARTDMERLQSGLHALSEGIIIWNANLQILFINHGMEQITGFSDADIQYTKGVDFLEGPETEQQSRQELRKIFAAIVPQSESRSPSRTQESTYALLTQSAPFITSPSRRSPASIAKKDSKDTSPSTSGIMTLKRPNTRNIKTVFHRHDGSPFWANLTISLVEQLPGVKSATTIMGVLTDISLEKQAEHAMEAARRATEETVRAKDEFLGNMTHEIRAPLHGIISASALLMESVGSLFQEDQRDLVQIMQHSSQHLLGLTESVLDFGRLMNQTLVLNQGLVNVGELLDRCISLLSPRAKSKGLALTLHIENNVPQQIYTDAMRLQQIVTNLMSNGLNFTESGSVDIHVSAAEVDKTPGPDKAQSTTNDQNTTNNSNTTTTSNTKPKRHSGNPPRRKKKGSGRLRKTVSESTLEPHRAGKRFTPQNDSDDSSPANDSSDGFGTRERERNKAKVSTIRESKNEDTSSSSESEGSTNDEQRLRHKKRKMDQCKVYYVHFRVTDTGIGICDEAQEKLFTRFTQGDQGPSRKVGGVGLGLSICRHLATLMGGNVVLEKSSPGQGSTFCCTIRAPGMLLPPDTPADVLRAFHPHHTAITPPATPPAATIATQLTTISPATTTTIATATSPATSPAVTPTATPPTSPQNVQKGLTSSISGTDSTFSLAVTLRNQRRHDSLTSLPFMLPTGQARSASILSTSEPLREREKEIEREKERERGSAPAITVSPATPILSALAHLEAAPVPDSPLPSPDLLRILVAEDNKINRAVLLRMLKLLGYTHVDIVENGNEVLELLLVSLKRYDVILMDLHMPLIDGMAATRALQSAMDRSDWPIVIAITADVTSGIEVRCRDAGMQGYISKPITKSRIADLLVKIAKLRTQGLGELQWLT